MASLKETLIEILIHNKLITPQQLETALKFQKEKGGRLSDILINLNFIKEEQLMLALSQGLGCPVIDLKRYKIDPEIVKIIPLEIARHYQIIALSKIGETLTLAMADPLNIFAIDHVEALTGYKINPIIASSKDILQAIDTFYLETMRSEIDNLVKEMSGASLELIKEEKETLPSNEELYRISKSSPVIRLTNAIIEEAIKRRASDILIEPEEDYLQVRYRIDGILQKASTPPKGMHHSIVSRIKVMANLNVAEHRLPQDGRFKLKIENREVDFRVSIIPSTKGEKVSLRILDKAQAMLDIDKLGFSQENIDKIKKVAKLPHGMILVCGPTGSGKTTTLYSILKFIDTPQKNIVTVEDPVEYQLEGINQVIVKPEIGLTFASALRSILRQDPNVIMIGEIRDFETVDIAIKSALTGHLVLSTLHTTTSSGAIVRLINMGVEPYLINASLVCVIAQRLLRKLCPYCKEEYTLKREVAKNINVNLGDKEEIKIFRAKGCPRCFNLGYLGRIGIAEVLLLTPGIRDLVLKRAQEYLIKHLARQEGMTTLREEGLRLVFDGVTTLEEVLKATISDD